MPFVISCPPRPLGTAIPPSSPIHTTVVNSKSNFGLHGPEDGVDDGLQARSFCCSLCNHVFGIKSNLTTHKKTKRHRRLAAAQDSTPAAAPSASAITTTKTQPSGLKAVLKKIKQRVAKKLFTPSKLASLMGKTTDWVREMLKGEVKPTDAELKLIEEHGGVKHDLTPYLISSAWS